MEVWSWTDCDMGYAVSVYWYGDHTTTSNRNPDAAGALQVQPVPENYASGKKEQLYE
jgi:hypothetical protein